MDDELRAMFDALRGENVAMRQEFAAMREETRSEFAAIRKETRSEFAAMREENAAMRQEFTQTVERIGSQFGTAVDKLYDRIQLVAEGVLANREMIEDVHDELRRTTSETQAMMKFLHADLQARVERLEASMH